MAHLNVSELAEHAGIAPSAVRYYERVGLLSPPSRAANGYRVYDEDAVAELAFIAKAQGIGMTLDEIQELLTVWPTGECRLLQARLRQFLVDRIAQVQRQVDELSAFRLELESVLGRLSERDPGPEQCGRGCGCEADLDPPVEGPDTSRGGRSRTMAGGRR